MEYEVPACSLEDKANGECVHTKTAARLVMPRGGHIVYGVSHQHSGGLGSALYGEVIACFNFALFCTKLHNLYDVYGYRRCNGSIFDLLSFSYRF